MYNNRPKLERKNSSTFKVPLNGNMTHDEKTEVLKRVQHLFHGQDEVTIIPFDREIRIETYECSQ